jgi:hypothetical protein
MLGKRFNNENGVLSWLSKKSMQMPKERSERWVIALISKKWENEINQQLRHIPR